MINQPMIKSLSIHKITNHGQESIVKEDILAIEEPLEIKLQLANKTQKPISVTMRTPGNDADLAIGFLFTEGIIFSKENLAPTTSLQLSDNSILIPLSEEFHPDIEKLKRNFYTTSSCGVCGKESIEAIKQTCKKPLDKKEIQVAMNVLFSLPEKFLQVQQTFESTGGIHASALFDKNGNLTNLKEDVGRHNALDKIIGSEFLKSNEKQFSLQDKILLLSGRASFELIQKSAMAGIQIVCAIGAPSTLAVETAESFGITLVGFLKNGSTNIYCGSNRIIRS